MRGTPSPLCLSPLLGPWDPLLLGVCPGGPLSLHSLFCSQASSKCLHTYPSRAHLLWMWSARVHVWAHVYVCEVTKPHPRSFPVFKSPALPDEVDNYTNKNGFSNLGFGWAFSSLARGVKRLEGFQPPGRQGPG